MGDGDNTTEGRHKAVKSGGWAPWHAHPAVMLSTCFLLPTYLLWEVPCRLSPSRGLATSSGVTMRWAPRHSCQENASRYGTSRARVEPGHESLRNNKSRDASRLSPQPYFPKPGQDPSALWDRSLLVSTRGRRLSFRWYPRDRATHVLDLDPNKLCPTSASVQIRNRTRTIPVPSRDGIAEQ